jgi:glutamate/tyrosine decarboxylase-like PLP-dependent enzyme
MQASHKHTSMKYQELLTQAFSLIDQYLRESDNPKTKVVDYYTPQELASRIDLSLPDEGCSSDEMLGTIKEYLRYCVRTGHPQYFNQLWSGFSMPGFLGEVFTSLTNTSMFTYEVAPVATLMEKVIIKRMGAMLGFQNPGGQMTTGGSNGNLIAMMVARNEAAPKAKELGISSSDHLVAFVSREAHYSFDKAANILGLGARNLIKIPSDERGRMIPQELERQIQACLDEKRRPFFVGATVGTTLKGAFDPCDAIADIAEKYGLWFHVDGALGGAVALSPKHRYLLKGSERAKSFVWDTHKMMGLSLMCSLLFVKDKENLLHSCSTPGTSYLFHNLQDDFCDLGIASLQCGRRVDALKLWLAWKYYGLQGFAERVERFFQLAKHAEVLICEHPHLELMSPRESISVCFRYNPAKRGLDPNEFNIDVRNRLAQTGTCLVNYGYIGDEVTIRLTISNLESQQSDIDAFFRNFIATATALDHDS